VFSFRWLEAIRDVRFALRMLRKAPGITAAAVITLAVGVGLNTAIFSLVQSVLLRQLPYRDPAAIVSVTQHDSAGPARFVSATTVRELRIRSRTLESVSVYADGQMTLVDLQLPVRRRSGRAEHVTDDGCHAARGGRGRVVLSGPRGRPHQSTRRPTSAVVARC
jgi:hypothetical protein